jgi:Ca-activated chloride channel family protein
VKSLALVMTVLLLTVLGIAQTVPAQTPGRSAEFKAGIDVVSLNILVTDQRRHLVAGLGREDFAIFEDGVAQDVEYFAESRVPLDLALVLDVSASMAGQMKIVQDAAVGFVKALDADDRAAVVTFNDVVRELQGFTGDTNQLEAAIRRMKPSGSTALRTAVYIALRRCAKRSEDLPDVRRQAIVVLSDGDDTSSSVDSEQLLDAAKRSGVAIYPIAIKPRPESSQVVIGLNRPEYELRALAQETGGRVFFPQRFEELAGVYEEITSELGNQYSLGYVSRNQQRDGKFRRVSVKIATRPDAVARARSGYFAQSEPRPAWRADTR